MATTMTFRTSAALVAATLIFAPQSSAWALSAQPADAPEQEEGAAPDAADGGDEATPAEGEPGSGEAGEPGAEGEPATAEGEGAEGEDAQGEGAEGESAEGEGAEDESGEGEGAEEQSTEAAPEEAEPTPPAPSEAVPAPETPADTGPQRPEEPTIGGRPAKGTGLMIAGGSLMLLGTAGLVTVGLITQNCSFDGPLKCKYQNQGAFLIPMMAAPTLLGAILLAVGGGYRVRYKKWERWTPAQDKKSAMVLPVASRQGGGVAVVGRF